MCRLVELTDKGHNSLIRYRELKGQRDLNESIRYFEHARDQCPQSHPSRASVLFNLATAKLIHCRMNDMTPDLDVPINLYRDALRLRPPGHPDHPLTLLSLGIALEARLQRQHGETDDTEGKSLLSQVLDITLADSYMYHAAVLALGSAAKPELIRPKKISHPVENDLDDDGKVQRLDAALQWMFHADAWEHVLLDHLGILFCIQFYCIGDLGDPEDAIPVLEVVLQNTSNDHPDRPSWLYDLGGLFSTRYERFGDIADLEKSISLFEDTVKFTPDGHPDKPLRLNNFGDSLSTRFLRIGDVTDLEKSISLFEDAV